MMYCKAVGFPYPEWVWRKKIDGVPVVSIGYSVPLLKQRVPAEVLACLARYCPVWLAAAPSKVFPSKLF